MAQNLNNFGNELERDGKNQLTFVQADTNAIQAQYIASWLNDEKTPHIDHTHANQTAVVLGDETMLQPTLHALPIAANGKVSKGVNGTAPS